MNEFYELAKLFDVVVIFCFFLGIGMYGIISTITDLIFLIHKTFRKHRIARKAKKNNLDNKQIWTAEGYSLPSVFAYIRK